MALLASEIITSVKALLNDTAGTYITDAVVLPYLKKAVEALQDLCLANKFSILEEVAANQTILAGATALSAVPSDVMIPISIYERSSTSTSDDDWELVSFIAKLPLEEENEKLEVWTLREDAIEFRGATTDRVIKYRYYKRLTLPTAAGDTITPQKRAKNYLDFKTAHLMAKYALNSADLASLLTEDLIKAEDLFMSAGVQFKQNSPVHRIPLSKIRSIR